MLDMVKLRLHKTHNKRLDNSWNFYNTTLRINLIPYLKMFFYTQASQGEISGLGKIRLVEEDKPIITKVLIFKQECTSAFTALNEEIISRFVVDLVRRNEDPQEWRLWWHSHNDFGVGWSSVDEECIAQLSKDATLFSICINKDGDMIGRVDENGNTSEVSINILPHGYNTLRNKCFREVERKVKIAEPEETEIITTADDILVDDKGQQNAIFVNNEVLTYKELEERYGLHPSIFYD